MNKVDRKAFEDGVRLAAGIASSYDHTQEHPYKIEDCILAKLNMIPKSKIRRNRKKKLSYCLCAYCVS